MTIDFERRPSANLDFWSDESIGDPYPGYAALRELGPVVWLERHGVWVVTRYDELRDALRDGETFSSAEGCMLSDQVNQAFKGIMLCSDDPYHRRLRVIFSKPLMPAALAPLKDRLRAVAAERIDELLERETFDAVSELAHLVPLTVVTELVGMSDEGKSHMLHWAAGIFNAFGPETHARTLSGIEITMEAFAYLQKVDRADLDPEGWGAALFDAADRGELDPGQARAMLMDYLAPALDTTINATSSAIALFASNPEQWELLRTNPALVQQAFDEVVRLESPIRSFARYVTRDVEFGGASLRQGDRALMLYASGNRDERKYPHPERFDITRNAKDHVGFGYGTHVCAGMHLAKLEVTTVLELLAEKVARFHLKEAELSMHNTLRGYSRLLIGTDRS